MPERYAPIALVLLLVGFAYRSVLESPFFGSDTWPWLVSTQLHAPSDVFRVAFSPIMSGTRFVDEVALFSHPVTALSYSFDQAVFGLQPAGFYATNLLLHLAAVAAVYALARGLGASRWAASAGALVLGLHPIAAATVPSLPRRQDLVVGAALLGSMSLLARAGGGAARLRWPVLGGSLALYVVALGGKEIAYAGLAVVPLILLSTLRGSPSAAAPGEPWWRAKGLWPPATVRRAAGVLLGFVVVEAAAFALRWRVLGGLGGYYGTETARFSLDGVLEFFVRPYGTDILWPFAAILPVRLRDWLLVVGLIGVLVAVGVSCLRRQRLLVALLGVGWQAAFVLLYIVVHTSLSPYLLYVPLAGLALLAGALVDGGVDWLQRRVARTAWPTVAAALSALLAAILLLGILRTSALVVDYAEFRDAGNVSRAFTDQALPCIAAAPPGTVVVIDGLPHRIAYGTAESQFVDAFVFEPYSIESVVRLLAPGAAADVTVRSTQDVLVRPNAVSVSCVRDGSIWLIATQLSP